MLALLGLVLGWVGTTHIHLSPSLVELLSGVAVPLVVGWLTKLHAASSVKALLNLALSAIAGGLTILTTAKGDVVLSTWLLGMGQVFLYSIVSYYGVWQHTLAPKIQLATPNFGIGAPVPPTTSSGVASRDDILPIDVAEPADAVVAPARPVRSRKAPTKPVATKKRTPK